MRATNRTMRTRGALVLAALLALSACGVEAGQEQAAETRADADIIGSDVADTTTTAPSTTVPPAPTDVDILGSDGSELNDVIGNTISDLEAFWTEVYPEAYGAAYEPLSGGLFAIDSGTDPSSVPCASSADISELLDNAYYCPPADAVVWDQERFLPDLADRYGTFTAAVVIAHEWGHAIQERAQFTGASVTTELQADCFAGAWVQHVTDGGSPRFTVTTDDLDQALAGVLSLRDAPGGFADDPSAHGSGFDRVGAFQDGFESGADRCADFTDGDPAPYEFPFSDEDEAGTGGDLHLAGSTDDPGIIELAFPSLDAFWTDTFPTLSEDGDDWQPLSDPVPFSADDPPTCNNDPIDGYLLFVCIPDRYVGFEAIDTIPAVYEQGGDFAVATLFATQYGLDAVEQLGTADDEVSATLQGDCFAGAWAAALLPPNPPDRYELVLSPGDLDEGVAVLLSFRSEGDRERQGPGFDRVRAYRQGVLNGPEACPKVS
ncbi:MAG: putative metalloprotease [Ilumatobacteraceae bacterium]|nr:putative metalloprotease [Ilumatobacteraceae bacterium]